MPSEARVMEITSHNMLHLAGSFLDFHKIPEKDQFRRKGFF
jgi:hypothetical protein